MSSGPRRLARALGTLALVAGGIAVALAIGETVARLGWQPEHDVRPPAPAGLLELTTERELMQPHVEGVYNGAYYRTNGSGFRGPDYERAKAAGVFRVVIAGDSVTMGSGVREEDAYPHLVEEALNRRSDGVRYEVLNLGLIGIDVRQVVSRLARIGLAYEPDLIVYGCTLNDIKGPHYRKSMAAWAPFDKRGRLLRFSESRSYLLRVLWPHWESLRDLVSPRPGTYLYELRDNYLDNPPAWADFTAGLDALAKIGAATHVPAVVFIHTQLDYLNPFHPYHRFYARIAEAAEARGLRAIQSFPALAGHDALALWVGPFDGHPNAAGHRLLARALLDGLERLPAEQLRPRS